MIYLASSELEDGGFPQNFWMDGGGVLATLRVQAPAAFQLYWSADEWHTVQDTASCPTALEIGFVDIPVPPAQRAPIRFTSFWTDDGRWEGLDYAVL